MKRSIKIGAALLFASAAATPVATLAANEGTAAFEVLQAITMTNAQTLSFGKFLAATSGTITIAGDAGTVGGTAAASVVSGTASVGQITITGSASETVVLTFPGTVTVTNPDTTTLSVSLFTDDGLSSSTETVALDGSGNGTATFGGSITLAGTESVGVFTGNFNVTAAYQ